MTVDQIRAWIAEDEERRRDPVGFERRALEKVIAALLADAAREDAMSDAELAEEDAARWADQEAFEEWKREREEVRRRIKKLASAATAKSSTVPLALRPGWYLVKLLANERPLVTDAYAAPHIATVRKLGGLDECLRIAMRAIGFALPDVAPDDVLSIFAHGIRASRLDGAPPTLIGLAEAFADGQAKRAKFDARREAEERAKSEWWGTLLRGNQ